VIPIETEVPKMLLLLDYPFSIKKSDLQSFTNPRSLGSLLGAMEWIVNSLNVRYSYHFYFTFKNYQFLNYESNYNLVFH
jgi:SMC interacting uncharacterized protein involved in chromosome segregation